MVISETSRFRLVWDVWVGILVLASCVLIPFQVAFQHTVSRGGTLLVLLIDAFCLLDVVFNFVTSYRHEGMEVRDRRSTASRYLRTLFPVDLLANFPLDVCLLGLAEERVAGVSVVLLARLPRLFRVVRLFVILRRWREQSWTNAALLRIVGFLVVATLLMHWIACTWFFVAYVDGFPADCWVAVAEIQQSPAAKHYVRSLYWTVVTMTTVGYGDITPTRDVEYVFSMLVMLLGASGYAFIIGNVASLFNSLDAAKTGFWNRVEAASQYLRARNVPADLNERVRSYYEYVWARHRGLRDRTLFDDLPGSLRLEVLLHLTGALMERVPLFRYCSPALRNELLMALKAETHAPGGVIAQEGQLGEEIYFLSRGKVEITSGDGSTIHGTLQDGEYFGDLSLLLGERRTASIRALTYCEVFLLTKQAFNRIRDEYPELRDVLKKTSSERTAKLEALVLKGIVL